jgi:preprotein translocase subunit SecG
MEFDKELQRETAKIGMTATLGVTVATSLFMKNKAAKKAHIIAGVAFCAFTLWHGILYDSKKKANVKEIEIEEA